MFIERIRSQVGLGLLGSTVALVTPLALVAMPRSETVALVGRAGSDTGELVRMVAEAGGSILNRGGRPNVLIARSDSAGFVGRLYEAGARLVLDGGVAGGCGRADQARTPPRNTQPASGNSDR
ncbi:hypothetical protein MKK75_26930 [Methylobacterium sp. J-030]|uniref:hypothetical protein n=1 Tax=Methylobacterium sp. J-030 TaxID=2836627 RepID=UPI001FB91C25|nr:hypothetical protein [Methylobacterium sp. J-030]MCJ2072383.1 hypothetical protein [Methylobacterium sp. J-030]